MSHPSDFWRLEHLPDAQLIESLHAVLLTKRRALAEVIAHLGEVEERRLHLLAAHGSMFDYCVSRLNMSEDEACRRIELARLARKFPCLFSLLARGEISLSVALLLKPVLTADNHCELLDAARGRSMRQTRELLAARFPSPDVSSNIRKLPERAASTEPTRHEPPAESHEERREAASLPVPSSTQTRMSAPARAPFALAPHPLSRIEPLSVERYRVQFTADAALKKKLELARDLLLHAHPGGDFAPVVSRALDLLLADLQRRRFGAGARARSPKSRPAAPASEVQSQTIPAPDPPAPASSCSPSVSIPRKERRRVLERDGLACSWVNADGTRCASRAWLELDHRHPRGMGGSSDAPNLRMLCRAHNQLAAELEYGRAHMDRARVRRHSDAQLGTAHGVGKIDGPPVT
jgi:hypothetical protein